MHRRICGCGVNLSGKKQILIGLKACLSIGLLSWLAAKVNVGDALHHVEKTDSYFLAGSVASDGGPACVGRLALESGAACDEESRSRSANR